MAFIYLLCMQSFIEKLKENAASLCDFDKLGEFVRSFDYSTLNFESFVPKIEDKSNYARNILMMHPIEVAVLHWPAGVASAVHYHQGFYGYVVVLKGQLNNEEYRLGNEKIHEAQSMCGLQGGILPERDGVVHRLVNASSHQPAITLHIYYPPLESFEGMKIYDLQEGKVGVLSAQAQTASWQEPESSFEAIHKNAFTYIDAAKHKKASHRIFPILPKPSPGKIYEMLGGYYDEQAHEYDFFDTSHVSRSAYNTTVNQLIADEYKQRQQLKNQLALACGTGKRAAEIKELSQKEYHIVGVDLSSEMCEIARQNGVEAYNQQWLEADLPHKKFDVITFLYAFGHICSHSERKEALQKVYKYLNKGGAFYFDVFNVLDDHEWGPKAVRAYEQMKLERMGYDIGDVFYKKNGGKMVAFLHYFNETDLRSLLEECGFFVEWIKYIGYTHQSGEVINDAKGGVLFIKAVKK